MLPFWLATWGLRRTRVFMSLPNKKRIFVLIKKIIQHPKICNEENVPYLQMDNEDSFKVFSKNYFCVTVFIVCHSFLDKIIP